MASGRQAGGRWGHLPLPLVQLLQGSTCAKTAAERFFYARQLWEVTAWLLSYVVLADWQRRRTQLAPPAAPGVPSLLEWMADKTRLNDHHPHAIRVWRWLRLLLPTLCNVGDVVALRLRDWLYAESPSLDADEIAPLQSLLGLSSTSPTPRCLADWLESFLLAQTGLIELENAHPVHSDEWNRRTACLTRAWWRLTQAGQFFREHRLVFVTQLARQPDGSYRLCRLELSGATPHLLPSLRCRAEIGDQQAGGVYLELSRTWFGGLTRNETSAATEDAWPALCLHPWITFQTETQETFFLQPWPNSRHGDSSASGDLAVGAFVCPVSGRILQPPDWMESARQSLEQLARDPVTAEYVRQWTPPTPPGDTEGPTATIFPSQHSAGFELLSEVTSGPQAVGYRAWQVSLRRPVRLQCLLPVENRPPLAELELVTLLALSRIHHPHLVKVYEHGLSDKVTYIATEFVPGVSLAGVMEQLRLAERPTWPSLEDWYQAIRLAWQEESRRERPLCILHTYERRLGRYLFPPQTGPLAFAESNAASDPLAYLRQVVRLIADISESLHTLHQAGAVHGSIVPGRILLTSEDGRPVLLEPGSFHDLAGRSSLAQSWRFLSPESRNGAVRLDPQSDMYSLAAILADLLLLTPETLLHEEARKARLAQLRFPALDRLAEYLSTCLAAPIEVRPATALDFANTLREYLGELEKSSSPSRTATGSTESVAATGSVAATATQESVKSADPPPSSSLQQATPFSIHQAVHRTGKPTRTYSYLLAVLASGVTVTVLLAALFVGLSWWLNMEPAKLLALLSERALNWIPVGWNDDSPARITVSVEPTSSSAVSSGPDLERDRPTLPEAPTLPVHSPRSVSAPEPILPAASVGIGDKPEAKPSASTASQDADRNQELVRQLQQELQQAQETARRSQEQYQSARMEVEKLQKQLQSAWQAEKSIKEEAAALALKLETLAAKYQTLQKTSPLDTERISDLLFQLVYQLTGDENRYNYPRRIRRPLMLSLRQTISETVRFLEEKKGVSMLSLGSAYLSLALLHQDCESFQEAETAYQQALSLLNQAPQEIRNRQEYRALLYRIHVGTGRLYQEQKKYAEAEAAYLQSLSIAEQLAREEKQQEAWRFELARCHERLGQLYRRSRQLDKAEAAYDHAVRMLEKLAEQRPEESAYALHLARAHQGLAYIAELRDQVESADRRHQQAITILEQLLHRQPENPECQLRLAAALHDRAVLYRDAGQIKEALPLYTRSLELVEALRKRAPENLEVILSLRDIYADRAHAYMALGRYSEALQDWEEAWSLDGERLPSVRAYRAICLARLGNIDRAAGEADKLSSSAPKTGSLLYNLACIHAVLAETLARSSKVPTPELQKQTELHAARAIEFLQQAAEQGYFQNPVRLEYLHQDPDLEFLRPREDFKRLLEKLSPRQ